MKMIMQILVPLVVVVIIVLQVVSVYLVQQSKLLFCGQYCLEY